MSQTMDNRVDALRQRLIETAKTPVGMGNARQMLRSYQEMFLELINITDAINAQTDEITPEIMAKLKAEAKKQPEGET